MNDNKSNVKVLNMLTKLDIPPDRLLINAIGNMEDVVIIGWDKNNEFYFSSSQANGGDILWLIELAKKRLLEV